MADRDTPVTLRTRKFIRNQLLSRRQMVVYVQSAHHFSFVFPEFRHRLLTFF